MYIRTWYIFSSGKFPFFLWKFICCNTDEQETKFMDTCPRKLVDRYNVKVWYKYFNSPESSCYFIQFMGALDWKRELPIYIYHIFPINSIIYFLSDPLHPKTNVNTLSVWASAVCDRPWNQLRQVVLGDPLYNWWSWHTLVIFEVLHVSAALFSSACL